MLESIQKRFLRYMIIYVWKILEKKVPNFSAGNEITSQNGRKGRKCVERPYNRNVPTKVQALRESSFGVMGPKLFNLLPKDIRDTRISTSVTLDDFKHKLDNFLSRIPDEPQLRGYTAPRQADTNSLVDMIPLVDSRLCSTTEEQPTNGAGGGRARRPQY